jgi:O-antigen/teichoic acid export membrane protein
LWGLRGLIGVAWSLRAMSPLRGAGRSVAHRRHQRALWPMQWRLACSWFAGYLSQQTIVPVAYALLGPPPAAQLGLAFFCTNGLLMVAAAWASARMPEFARLAAARRWQDFDALLSRVLRVTVLTCGAGLLMVVGLWALRTATPWAERLPAPDWFMLLVLAATASAAINAIATALRACGGDPFFAPTLVGGVLVLPMLAAGARFGDVTGLCVAYLGLCGGLGLPWALWLLRRHRQMRTAGR